MGINYEIYKKPAERGDISGSVIEVSIALAAVADALELLAIPIPVDPKLVAQRSQAIAERIKQVRTSSAEMDKIFDRLTGWVPDQ